MKGEFKMLIIICDGVKREVYPTTYEQLNGEWIATPAMLLKQAD